MKLRMQTASTLAVLMLVAAACSDSSTTSTTGGETADTTAPPPTTAVVTTTTTVTTTQPSAITEAPTTTTTEPVPTTTGLPGEPFDHPFFMEGDVLGVIGVASDDVLNVRSAPGIDQEIVARLDPLAESVVVIGPSRALSASQWIEVRVNGTNGWVNSGFLAYIGLTDDITAGVSSQLGEFPQAESMIDLGAMVAATRASEDPPSTISVTSGPTPGDLGKIIYDVVGLGDDAQLGERVHVFGRPLDGGGFELVSVEGTALCSRAVTPDGLCV